MITPDRHLAGQHPYRETALFSLLLWVYWASVVTAEGFLVPYLRENGYSAYQAGLVMSAVFLLSIPGQPLWGHVCDRVGRHRPVFVGSMVIAGAVMLLVPVVINSLAAVLALVMVLSFTASSMPGNLDGWIMARRARIPGIEYGVARGMGSLGYAMFAVILGSVLDRWGLHLIFPVFTGFALTSAILAMITPDSGSRWNRLYRQRTAVPEGSPSLVHLIRHNHRYRAFVVSAVILFTAFRATYTFLPVLIMDLGGGNRHIGLAHSVAAATEIPVMFLAGWIIRRVRADRMILGSMIIFVVRMAFYPLARNPETIIALQALHGVSFGLFLAASVYYIDEIAPAGSKSLFQTLAPSMYFGLGSVTGSAVGGAVVEALGLSALFWGAPVMMFGAAILFRFYTVRVEYRENLHRRDSPPV
jgi:MFS transporter, PPP family, 3-phenylpropionic acid transporter